jgi:hypothetical protein
MSGTQCAGGKMGNARFSLARARHPVYNAGEMCTVWSRAILVSLVLVAMSCVPAIADFACSDEASVHVDLASSLDTEMVAYAGENEMGLARMDYQAAMHELDVAELDGGCVEAQPNLKKGESNAG